MKILIGTTNPSKVKLFSDALCGYNAEFCTLDELGIDCEPEETGSTPEENAVIKAKFYGQFTDFVICGDSGLYFDCLPLDDPRQPGLHIRTPGGKQRLNDEEMIAYYSQLVQSLGGRVLACYLNGIAVCSKGQIFSFAPSDELTRQSAFYMTAAPSDERHPGWPLDSLSLYLDSGKYFTDKENGRKNSNEDSIVKGEYRKQLTAFLCNSLGLK